VRVGQPWGIAVFHLGFKLGTETRVLAFKLARKVRVNVSLRSLVIFRILEYPWL
jgi:hypothetical protein